jgi:cell division protein FtsN
METKPTFDHFLASSLKDHRIEPSEGVKAQLMLRLGRDKALRAKQRTRNIILSMTAAAILAGIWFLYSIFIQTDASMVQPDKQPIVVAQDQPANVASKDNIEIASKSGNITGEETESRLSEPSSEPVNQAYINSQHPADQKNQENDPQVISPSQRRVIPFIMEVVALERLGVETNAFPVSFQKQVVPVALGSIDAISPDTLKPQDKPEKRNLPARSNTTLAAGVQYTPEWMFNTVDLKNKYVHNFGLEFFYSLERYSIRTGAGLSIAQGVSEIAYAYNDYLATYKKLDSISYSFDNQNNRVVPKYYLSDQDIYDTALNTNVSLIEKRYTYLQIPLILGYDLLQTNRYSFGFRAGPMLSVLISEKASDDSYDPGKDKVLSTNNLTPDRIKTNWQAIIGMNAGYRFSPVITFELEPQFKYYFNSVYEKASTIRKPYSFEVRASLIYNINR